MISIFPVIYLSCKCSDASEWTLSIPPTTPRYVLLIHLPKCHIVTTIYHLDILPNPLPPPEFWNCKLFPSGPLLIDRRNPIRSPTPPSSPRHDISPTRTATAETQVDNKTNDAERGSGPHERKHIRSKTRTDI